MARNGGIRSAVKRLTLAVLAMGLLAGFWSASAFAQSVLGGSAGQLVGNATQAAGQSTAPVAATAQSAVPSTAAAASTVPAAMGTVGAEAVAATGATGNATTLTTAPTTNAVGPTLATAKTAVVQPGVDTVAKTVDAASESVSAVSRGTLGSAASLVGGAVPPAVQNLVTTAGTTAPPLSHPVVAGPSIAANRSGEQPVAAIEVIPPALASPVAPAAPGRAVSAPYDWVRVDPGSQKTLLRAQRHVTPAGGTIAPDFGGPRELTLPPARQAADAKRVGSLPRIPDIPGGLLAGTSATGASGGSTGLVAVLVAALLLALPRVARWLRPAAATRPLPISQLSLERPG